MVWFHSLALIQTLQYDSVNSQAENVCLEHKLNDTRILVTVI